MGALGSSPTTVWAPGMESQWILPGSTSPERRFRRTGTSTTFPFDNNAGELFVQRLSLTGQSLFTSPLREGRERVSEADRISETGLLSMTCTTPGQSAPPIPGRCRYRPGNALIWSRSLPTARSSFSANYSSDGNDIAYGRGCCRPSALAYGNRPAGLAFPLRMESMHHPGHCAVFVLHQDEAGNRSDGHDIWR